jgi:Fe-S-cluster-containing hydrogenase component 2
MKPVRKIIEIDEERCDGCGLCVPGCAEGALQIVDGKARLIEDKYCDGLGACLGECPNDALRTIDREADAFDEEAVEELLKSRSEEEKPAAVTLPSRCPSAQIQSFLSPFTSDPVKRPLSPPASGSALSHWPVQISLVPAKAPFLKGADLLIAADCTAFTYPNFHQDFLKGKALMVGCPKFDDAESYVRKFVEIFHQADIRSITILVIEVPCCQGLPMIVQKAIKMAGKTIPVEEVVISTRGEILKREKTAA